MKSESKAVINLDYPISWDGKEITQIIMRRPKVKDYVEQPDGLNEVGQDIYVFSKLTGINPEGLKEMDLVDMQKMQEAFRSFLSPKGARNTGETPSLSSLEKPGGATGS